MDIKIKYCTDPKIVSHETSGTPDAEGFKRPEFGWETTVRFETPYAYVALTETALQALIENMDPMIMKYEVNEEANEDARETYVGYAFQELKMGPEGPDTEIEWIDEATLIIRHNFGPI
jgi:hypothetical protein